MNGAGRAHLSKYRLPTERPKKKKNAVKLSGQQRHLVSLAQIGGTFSQSETGAVRF